MGDEVQRPTSNDDRVWWKAYWTAQGMQWRTEPEIDVERQQFLAEQRAMLPNLQHSLYPFKGITLTRADVEWLLATHESGGACGPVDWEDGAKRRRMGVDLRGAILNGQDLSYLPLARMRGGLTGSDYDETSEAQRQAAAVQMTRAKLRYTRLEGCALT